MAKKTDLSPRLFWPKQLGPYERELHTLLEQLRAEPTALQQLAIIRVRLQALPSFPNAGEAKLRFRAYLLVLADLLRQQWELSIHQGQLYLRPPAFDGAPSGESDSKQRKNALQQIHQVERDAQLRKPAVREFVRKMERERSFNGRSISIASLFADSEALAEQLTGIAALESCAAQEHELRRVIRPYLQLVTSDAVCSLSGYRLMDIWRYFRHTWTTPYNPTPGRQMFYLVRDAGQALHPVMGIAALGSSIVQLSVRDDIIGWTPDAITIRLSAASFDDAEARRLAATLRATLKAAIADLQTTDLVSRQELRKPTSATLDHLANTARTSRDRRIQLLQQETQVGRSEAGLHVSPNGMHDRQKRKLADRAKEALYLHKRSKVLQHLLGAKQTLDKAGASLDTAAGLRALWATPNGKQAISVLVRENKKRRIGSNMMDVIVCGALPPYNILLGGKLVAMLLGSPQVAHDYQTRYANYNSLIASEMKGRPVKRDAHLAFLGTTSLYSMGSSQYNRITIPIPNQPDLKLRYEKYGLTEGYGSVHFGMETVAALIQLQESAQQAKLIRNRFGEGVNPKLRIIRAGLDELGVVSDDYLQHRMQRIVYGVALGRQTFEFLRGEADDPALFFDAQNQLERDEATNYLVNYWVSRWLLARMGKREFVERVRAFRPATYLVSQQLKDTADVDFVQDVLPLE